MTPFCVNFKSVLTFVHDDSLILNYNVFKKKFGIIIDQIKNFKDSVVYINHYTSIFNSIIIGPTIAKFLVRKFDILQIGGGPIFVKVCGRGRGGGVNICQNSVTYFINNSLANYYRVAASMPVI